MVGIGPGLAAHVWKEWGIHMLVLLSFTLQVELRILAELRRRMDSSLLRSSAWAAYLLADSTAIYVLGHLSSATSSSRSPEHELMAFWAPFLLPHLGGQDNITAYAVEDNQLWLRHLQAFAVQVPAAAYVLDQSSILSSRRPSLRAAAILMLVVGVVKYGERVWALSRAGSISSGNNYRSFQRRKGVSIDIITPAAAAAAAAGRRDTEALVSVAYLLLPVPVDLLIVPLSSEIAYHGVLRGEEVYRVAEIQLSLMHDVFYTKAMVTYSPYGLCIRVIFLTSTAVALLLFFFFRRRQHHHHHLQEEDVAVTYVLLFGAVALEITSAMRALFSSWTRMILVRRSMRSRSWTNKFWATLSNGVASVRRLIHAAVAPRYWPACIGQHSLFQLCAHSRASRCSRLARWMGVEDPWNVLAYSTAIPVSASVEQVLVNQLLQSDNPQDMMMPNSRGPGRAELKMYEVAGWSWSDDSGGGGGDTSFELDERILACHIATDVYLSWYHKENKAQQEDQAAGANKAQQHQQTAAHHAAEAARALSNYMLFLAQPYMLPPPANRNAYVETCYGLAGVKYDSAEDLASLLFSYGDALNKGPQFQFPYLPEAGGAVDYPISSNTALQRGCQLGANLVAAYRPAADMLELISQAWAEMLCYAGYRCTAGSHVKQLSSGGELITVAALLVGYMKRRVSTQEDDLIF